MAKAPGLAPVKSRLHPSLTPERATSLYRCFLLDRLDALGALESIAPFIAFTPPEGRAALAGMAPRGFRLLPQRGADLGERLANLLEELLGLGHPGAMAVDSDSPTLPMSYVVEAAEILESSSADVVLGPCEDGGYYLVGTRAPQPSLFAGIPWSTERVLAETLERVRAGGLRVHLLPPWFDVDTEDDLRRLRKEMARAGSGPRRTFAFVADLRLRQEGEPARSPGGAPQGDGRSAV
jgi:rSAM/selenodomain-associated transferase 1